MKKQSPKQSASETENRPAPVATGAAAKQGAPSQAANPSGGNADAAQGTAGEPVRQWRGKTDGETEAQYLRRAFEWDGAKLSAMGAASWERWKLAGMVLHYGLSWAIENGAGYADILNRPEMLRAVECLINDPPEIAKVFLMPNPNPIQGGAVCDKDFREWILSTFQEWFEVFYTFGGIKYGVGEKWATGQKDERGVWRWGDLSTMRFYMFPACLDLACVPLRQTWAKFITVCGLPECAEMREWLEHDRKETGRGYVQMPELYEVAYSEEQYFDLTTGETNAPKYGGGGIKAAALLLNFRDYLRERQGIKDCEPVTRPNPSAAQGANPSAGDMAGGESVGVVNIKAGRVNVEGVTVAATATERKAQKAGHKAGGISQAIFAGFMGVTKKTVCRWENHPDKYPPPVVDGKTYEKGIRENGVGAVKYAHWYKETQRGALKTIGGDKGAGIAEKQAAQKWATKHAAELRAEGANLSEWEKRGKVLPRHG